MKQSLRARRMNRNHRRSKRGGKLSLISLMDIFTILVFFLLVNSSEVQVLQSHKSIKLPESTAEQKPDDALVVMVNETSILVDNRKVADTAAVMASDADAIEELKKELEYRVSRRGASEREQQQGRDVTVMGHRDIPYSLLKKIMTTLSETDYRNISLAVNRIAADDTVSDGQAVELDNMPAAED